VSEWTLDDISGKLRDIDFAMLLTHTESGEIAGRPMSNNRDVEYDGDSYFFTSEQTRTVADIERDRKVERWFEDGVETAGLVLIKVHASRIHYWDGENEGEFAV
jgi:general stress protein 26